MFGAERQPSFVANYNFVCLATSRRGGGGGGGFLLVSAAQQKKNVAAARNFERQNQHVRSRESSGRFVALFISCGGGGGASFKCHSKSYWQQIEV